MIDSELIVLVFAGLAAAHLIQVVMDWYGR